MLRKTLFRKIAAAFLFLFILGVAGAGFPQFYPTHLDRSKLPKGCLSCHAGGHGARNTALLRMGTGIVCLRCHDEQSTDRNINITRKTDLRVVQSKPSRHPIGETAGLHRKGENTGGKFAPAGRHAACEDCHDIHWSSPGKALEKVDGITSFGVRSIQAAAEYEVCYKCHSDSVNRPRNARNKRLEFNRNNPSFHPVEARGKSNRVPSLISPMSVSGKITCSDCHGNDDPLGPKGPHGSIYAPILALHYEPKDGLQENNFQYALCYKCHDRSSLLRDQSFPLHNLHILKVRASCYTCHNSHGSQINTHLMDFNPDVVGLPQQQPAVSLPQPAAGKPGLQQKQQAPPFPKVGVPALPQPGSFSSAGTMGLGRYVDLGNGHGQCFLNCHGKDHNPLSY